MDIPFIETSAKYNENVDELFVGIAKRILQTVKENDTEENRGTVSLATSQEPTKNTKCC